MRLPASEERQHLTPEDRCSSSAYRIESCSNLWETLTAPDTTGDGIRVRGCRVHNLRGVDLDIPHDALVVLTGVSGSGKSSLAFDTLFAESQRRYLESLSAYTRQFLHQLQRPDADLIEGLPPTISIDQRSGSTRMRQTLATTTEIYDYLRLLYARAGQAHCPACGTPVSRQSAQEIVQRIMGLEKGRKALILAPLVRGKKGAHRQLFERICKDGFVRARVDGDIVDAAVPPELPKGKPHDIEVVVDRVIVKDGLQTRLVESVELALKLGEGACLVSHQHADSWQDSPYSTGFACPRCGNSFLELEPRTFSYSSPYGACPACTGLGVLADGLGEDDESASLLESAPPCSECGGARLNAFARHVEVGGWTIGRLSAASVREARAIVEEWESSVDKGTGAFLHNQQQQKVAEQTLPEIRSRLEFLFQVGLDYLTLDRPTRTLSGGELRRARLAGCLGSGLIGICYILDEPTIGLHARDTDRLLDVLIRLRDQGNTVLVVEHDVDTMRRADLLIDLGPGAGVDGGQVVAIGTPAELSQHPASITGHYLAAESSSPAPQRLFVDTDRSIRLTGASRNNLNDLDVRIPLNVLTCVTGVSGSGKSSLVAHTLVPALKGLLAGEALETDRLVGLEGWEAIDRVVEVDQSPIGRSPRSNPATYSGLWDQIRRIFASTREARIRGYKPRRFSFNAQAGRCPACRGQGVRRIEMKFLPDLYVTCPECRGKRFNQQTLSVRFGGKTVADVLDMRIDEAAEFFRNLSRPHSLLTTFCDVGLGYLSLGQSSLSLSGGEAQRVKLATELHRADERHTLFVLDEPTTGLHPADVRRLIELLWDLRDRHNTVLVVEHHLDVVSAADWVIDLGPEGGAAGGSIVAEGRPQDVAAVEESHTGLALRPRVARQQRAD